MNMAPQASVEATLQRRDSNISSSPRLGNVTFVYTLWASSVVWIYFRLSRSCLNVQEISLLPNENGLLPKESCTELNCVADNMLSSYAKKPKFYVYPMQNEVNLHFVEFASSHVARLTSCSAGM